MLKQIRIFSTASVVVASMISIEVSAQVVAVAAVDTSVHVADSAAMVQPKKGGMFGKMKGLAHNKMAQGIVKGAVCAAVPGGSQLVGVINAKQAKSAAGIAGNAAAAAGTAVATSAAGSAVGGMMSGGGCIPGMASLSGLAGGGSGKSGLAAMAGTAVGGAAGRAGVAGVAGMAGGVGGSKGGATVASAGSVQTMSAQMQAVAAANAAAGGGVSGGANGAAAPAVVGTDAPGQQMELPGDMKAAVAKGKIVIKKIDWVQHGNVPSAPTIQMLSDVMKSVGAAIQQSGAKWRVDVYVGKEYQDAEAKTLAASRASTVVGMLAEGGAPAAMIAAGKAERDKEARVEVVKIK